MKDDSSPEGTAAFDAVYHAHVRAVRRHLLYLTGDKTLTEDLTQEAFGKLYERDAAGASEGLRNPQAWLLTVASRLAYNHFRTEERRGARESVSGLAAKDDKVAPQTDVDDVLDVRRALGRLGGRDHVVLMLRHSGFSYAEIAQAIDVAPSSVGTILARAQRRFREEYEGVPAGAEERA